MRKLVAIYVLVVAMFALSWSVGRAYSQDKGAGGSGVAGGARVARGKNDSARSAAKPRSTPPTTSDSSDEARTSNRRIREIETLEQQCLDEINRVRRRSGLPSLAFNEDLLPVAREYSRRMAEEHFFSHNDPDGKTVRERVDEADIRWRMIGENLAYSNGYVNPVAASLHGWMESPGHRKNILEPDFSMTAIGVWIKDDGTVYFTEIFLKQ
jgi:uncharacterized protein YkwD